MESLNQQLQDAKTPSQVGASDRKRKAVLRTATQPVYPRLAVVLLVCMLVLTLVLTAAELIRGHSRSDMTTLLRNISVSGLGMWTLYAVPLILVCLLGMRNNARRFHQKQAESGTLPQTPEEHHRNRRAIRRLNRNFIRCILLAAGGILLWGVFFLAAN